MARFKGLLLGIWVIVMSLSSCAKPTPFTVEARYRVTDDATRRYEVVTTGFYAIGADMAETYQGQIVVSTAETSHRLSITAEHFTPRLAQPEGLNSLNTEVGQNIDAVFLARWVSAVTPTISETQAKAEAQDLFAVLEAAGMGPKVGLPDTTALILVSVNYQYP
jgi:hypothetical protein